jgi:hypothetical protein
MQIPTSIAANALDSNLGLYHLRARYYNQATVGSRLVAKRLLQPRL